MSSSATQKAPSNASPADIGIFPYNPQQNRKGPTRSAKITKKSKNKSIPPNILTCLQVKAQLEMQTGSAIGISSVCTQCSRFMLDRLTVKRLRHLKDNNPGTDVSIPRHLQCQTWWIERSTTSSVVSPSSPSSSSSLPTAPSTNPPTLSTRHSLVLLGTERTPGCGAVRAELPSPRTNSRIKRGEDVVDSL